MTQTSSPGNSNQTASFRWGVPLKDVPELRVLLFRLGWAPVPGAPDVWVKTINSWREIKALLGPQSLEFCLHLPRPKNVTEPFFDYLFYAGVEVGHILSAAQLLPVFAKALAPGPAQHNMASPFLRTTQEVWDMLRESKGAGGSSRDEDDDEGDDDEDDEDEGDDDEDDDEG
jgi:hypothetical protein